MKDAKTIEKLWQETRDYQDLWDRIDKDYSHWALKPQNQLGSYGYPKYERNNFETELKIVSNSPRTFAENVQSKLNASAMDIAITMAEEEGEDKRAEKGQLERLFKYGFEKADERLVSRGLPPLKESSVWYSITCGWIAARILVYKDGDKVVFDYIPYDPRWLKYRMGKGGILWSLYQIPYTAEELKAHYGDNAVQTPWYKPWGKNTNSYNALDYWENEGNGKVSNGVVCNGDFIEGPFTYKIESMPVLIHPVATRPPVRRGTGSEMAGYGESIFAPNRETDDNINKMASVWASHAIRLAEAGIINYRTDKGVELEGSTHVPGGVMDVPLGENRIEPMPMKEISPTLINLSSLLEEWRSNGALPGIDDGDSSGTKYNLVQENSNRVFNPQIRNLNAFYSNICRLVEEQILMGGVTRSKKGKITQVDVALSGDSKSFSTPITIPDLKKPHVVKVEFIAQTAYTQYETAQQAEMLIRLGLPRTWVWENILRIQDAHLIQDLEALEIYEHSPQGLKKRAVQVLMDKKMFFEADKLAQEMDREETMQNAEVGQQARAGGAPTGTVQPTA